MWVNYRPGHATRNKAILKKFIDGWEEALLGPDAVDGLGEENIHTLYHIIVLEDLRCFTK